MELIRDSLWQFVGAILAFLAIIITIVIFLLQNDEKNYHIKSILKPLFSAFQMN